MSSKHKISSRSLVDNTYRGTLDMVKKLVEEGVDINELQKCDEQGILEDEDKDNWICPALVAAASQGHRDVVEFLLEKGANPNLGCCCGGNALYWAARNNRLEILHLLLATKNLDVNLQNDLGESGVHIAVMKRRREILECLLRYTEIDVNLHTKKEELTPLHIAVVNGFTEIALLLLSRKDIKISAKTNYGDVALTLAVKSNNMILLTSLMYHKDTTAAELESAVQIAAATMKLTALKLLLTHANTPPPRKLLEYIKMIGCSDEHCDQIRQDLIRCAGKMERGMQPEYMLDKGQITKQPMALIINVKQFDPETKLVERLGSDKDVESLNKVFTSLGFAVNEELSKKEHFTYMKMQAAISSFSAELEETVPMCAVVIMSHGGGGEIICSDGKTFSVEEILSWFNAKYCANLQDKPKLFVLNACRGIKENAGIPRRISSTSSQMSIDANPFFPSPGGDVTPTESVWNHFAIVYSTLPDHVSYRSEDEGSVFIGTLCKIFEQHAKYMHLAELLSKVSQELDHCFETPSSTNEVTCSIEYRNFCKRLYFNCTAASAVGETV